jgi:xylulose-5-phosphate/fructose-6-phosphate phosphoketolase
MRGYKPEELFDEKGAFRQELADLAPKGARRMGMNPHSNGGLLLKPLVVPNFRQFAVKIASDADRGQHDAESTKILGQLLHAVMQCNSNDKNFRVFGPDETASNRLQDVIKGVGKTWMSERLPDSAQIDNDLSQTGRVMEVLSEHLCQGWLEGYLLTGRHGFFSCYEAFIHIVDSMVNQHAKWLKVTRSIPWRKPIASLNYLLTSHVWRQDHNGFSHQDPGFIDHLLNKKADIVRIYLPPDANTLLSVADHCLRSRNYINLIVAGKQPEPQWLNIDEAVQHCTAGLGIWDWASDPGEPDIVMACAGDVPTLETMAAVMLLRTEVPDIKIRVVNVVDLMTLQPTSEHPHGLPDEEFDAAFTRDKPVIFAFHGYPWCVHRLTYRRKNHDNIHVRGYKEEGTTTTPFDMCVSNNIDRYQLTMDAIVRIPRLAAIHDAARQRYSEQIQRHRLYVAEHGEDLPEIRTWKWSR